jgi:uncharacterized protein
MSDPAPAIVRRERTRPRSPAIHLFGDRERRFALDVQNGRIHRLLAAHADLLDAQLRLGDHIRADMTAAALGIGSVLRSVREAPRSVPVKAISLSVAQACNLACTYCYAQHGTFGGASTSMPKDVAMAAINRLVEAAEPGERVTLAFMGGEPLANRKMLHAATRYAAEKAATRGVGVAFSMTTNATLLRQEDIALFQEFRFTLTISIDDVGEGNDRTRPHRSGKGSFHTVAKNVRALVTADRRAFRVLARVTVTPRNLDLPRIMDGLVEMGFDSVMFSPMLNAPSGRDEMRVRELDHMLEQLIRCGDVFRDRVRKGLVLPLANVITTLRRIHSYEQDQYPCGAGGGYMSVSAEGDLYACHRFVNDDDGLMGNVVDGVDRDRQAAWLASRHLDKQSPCGGCWARHLCSGSCHYEAIKRGRPACDYIRGWLDYCLCLYAELVEEHPEILRKILTLH